MDSSLILFKERDFEWCISRVFSSQMVMQTSQNVNLMLDVYSGLLDRQWTLPQRIYPPPSRPKNVILYFQTMSN